MIEDVLIDNEEVQEELQDKVEFEKVGDIEKLESVENFAVEEIKENKNPETNKPSSRFDNVLFNQKIDVYVKVDSAGFITDVQSSIFLKDKTGWIKIDEGFGDRFVYAQTCYFDKPILDEKGNYTTKFKD